VDLGVTRSHNRPHTFNDNPFSEAQFKSMKYRPDYPNRFDSIAHARQWAREFFAWYNNDFYHSGLNLLTPISVHYGEAEAIQQQRQSVMLAAYAALPTPCGLIYPILLNHFHQVVSKSLTHTEMAVP